MNRAIFKLVLSVATIFTISTVALAYLTWIPSYDQMTEEADLIVIATPIARRELQQHATLPGVSQGNKPVPAVAIETTFRQIAILKGKLTETDDKFILFHYREAEPSKVFKGGPILIDFTPSDGSQYLMFLKRREDGRHEAFKESDPGWCIEKLQQKLRAKEDTR